MDERCLLERCRSGDVVAFSRLVLAYEARVRAFIAGYVHSLYDVDDLAQEVFLIAYRRLSTYGGQSSFSTWLLGVARNKVLHHLRDSERRSRRTSSFGETLSHFGVDLTVDDDTAGIERKLSALERCLKRLPPESRDLVTRHYFGGESLADMARAQGKKEGALRASLFRTRKLLRECVRHDGAIASLEA